MKQSLKSTLYTFLPIILFFGWMQANLAFAPILPGEMFDVSAQLQEGVQEPATLKLADKITSSSNLTQSPDQNGVVSWSIQASEEGLYDASIEIGEEEQFFSFVVSQNVAYVDPVTNFDEDESLYFSSITVGNKKLYVFESIPGLNAIPWIKTFGWFGAYFLFSIIFSMSLRKLFKLS